MWKQLLFIGLGFLSGSVLYSRYLPKILKGVDIVALSEDHNPGTANVMRYAGVQIGILCLLCDMAKGFVPVFVAARHTLPQSMMFALILAAPVAGHAFSVFHKGKGGKAIAVTFGCLIGRAPEIWPLSVLCILYLLFSLVIVIRPNEKRTVLTFLCFAAAVIVRTMMGRMGTALGVGLLCQAGIVIYKNYPDAQTSLAQLKTRVLKKM